MEELAKIIKGFDDEKKKKLFSELSEVKTVEGIIDIGNNYNLNVSKEVAQEVYDGLKNTEKLSKDELAKVAAGSCYAETDNPGCTYYA